MENELETIISFLNKLNKKGYKLSGAVTALSEFDDFPNNDTPKSYDIQFKLVK